MKVPKIGILGILAFALVVGTPADAADLNSPQPWSRQEIRISGSWSVVEEEDRLYVELDDRFKTRSAPDLKIFLSRSELSTIDGKNATENAVLVAPCVRPRGSSDFGFPMASSFRNSGRSCCTASSTRSSGEARNSRSGTSYGQTRASAASRPGPSPLAPHAARARTSR